MNISAEDKMLLQTFLQRPIPVQRSIFENISIDGPIDSPIYSALLSVIERHDSLDDQTKDFADKSKEEKMKYLVKLKNEKQDDSDDYRNFTSKYAKDHVAKSLDDYETSHYYFYFYVDILVQYYSNKNLFIATSNSCTIKQKLDILNMFSLVDKEKVDHVVYDSLKLLTK